jgi:small subunit ribosomal protein S3
MAIERLFIGEGIREAEVKKFLRHELKRAGIAEITILRTPLVTRIVIFCDRPAIVIGRKGRNVKHITRVIEEDYKIEKPELEIKKTDNPRLEPDVVAYQIASALEMGTNPRRVGYQTLQSIIRDGAKGAEIVMSGKLVGKGGRARTLKMKAGYMKKCGEPSFTQVKTGFMMAVCKPGTIGIKVRIVPKDVHFPDEVKIIMPEEIKIQEEVVEGGTPEKLIEEAAKEKKIQEAALEAKVTKATKKENPVAKKEEKPTEKPTPKQVKKPEKKKTDDKKIQKPVTETKKEKTVTEKKEKKVEDGDSKE